jgi:hypothetical protein
MGGARHSTTVQDVPNWMRPAMQQFLGQYEQAALPGGQIKAYDPNMNQQVAGFSPFQEQAFDQTGQVAQGIQPMLGASQAEVQKTMAGDYLNPETNPYLQRTYDDAARAVTDKYRTSIAPQMATMSQEAGGGGAPGGSAYQQAAMQQQYGLGQNLSELANQVYGGNYQAERARQLGATEAAPGIAQAQFMPSQALMQAGSQQQQQQQLGYDTSMQNAMRREQYPFTVLDRLGAAFGQAQGGAGTTTQPNRAGTLK